MRNLLIKISMPLGIIAFGVGIVIFLQENKPEPEKKDEVARPLSVYVTPARRSDIDLIVSSEGEVRAKTLVNLVSQVAGRVISVSPEFTEGGSVQPGESLIQIESIDYELALSQAEARVAEAEFGVEEATAMADVAKKQLRNAKYASALALKIPQVAQAKSKLKAAQAGLEQAQVDLSRTRISLPFSGRIASKHVDVGQYVTPGLTLATAFSTEVVEVRLSLDDAQLASLDLPIGFVGDPESPIRVNLSAQVAGKMQYWQGSLVRLGAALDSASRTLFGLVQVTSPYADNVSQHDMPLAVGLYVKAEIQGRQVPNATIIVRSALRAGDNVYVINSDSRLEIRRVSVVHSTNTEAVIGEGLQPGDQVIVSSIRNPIPGMAVSALSSEPLAPGNALAAGDQ